MLVSIQEQTRSSFLPLSNSNSINAIPCFLSPVVIVVIVVVVIVVVIVITLRRKSKLTAKLPTDWKKKKKKIQTLAAMQFLDTQKHTLTVVSAAFVAAVLCPGKATRISPKRSKLLLSLFASYMFAIVMIVNIIRLCF